MITDIVWGNPNSFMPSGLIQWIALIVFVLLGVILVRKIFKIDERYHSKPMKHK